MLRVRFLDGLLASMGGFILMLELLGIGSIFAVGNSALSVDILASLLIMPVIIALIAHVICSNMLSMLDRLTQQMNSNAVAMGREIVYTPSVHVSRIGMSLSHKELPIKLLLLVLGTVGLGYPAALLVLANLANRYFRLAGCRNVINRRTRALQPATLGLAGALLIVEIKNGINKCLAGQRARAEEAGSATPSEEIRVMDDIVQSSQ